jgi:acetyltransferase-like isoleucine patch superfamily enzyme
MINKYLSHRLWLDFARRKLFFYARWLFSFREEIWMHKDADVSLLASIRPLGGSIRIARYCQVDRGAIIRGYGGRVEIGELSTIGPYTALYGGGDLVIGRFVRVGPHVAIIAGNHAFKDSERLIIEQGMIQRGIHIEDDVWIGAGARILDGVTLRKGSVVGAGAVVTKSTRPYEVIAGIPARVISRRIPITSPTS